MRSSITKENFRNALAENRIELSEYRKIGIFIFTNKKHDGTFNEIGIIKCEYAYGLRQSPPPEGVDTFGVNLVDLCFEDYLPLLKFGFYQRVEEGDILNIRTMINLDFPLYPEGGDDVYGHLFDEPDKVRHLGNTYLATFLIELDPL